MRLRTVENKLGQILQQTKLAEDEARQMGQGFLRQFRGGEGSVVAPEFLSHGLATIDLLFALVLLLVAGSYLVTSLYTDRRDQSILFWKSLPVSEYQNVLTKLGAGVLGAPVFYTLAAMLTGILYLLIFAVYGSVFWDLALPGVGPTLTTFLASAIGLVLGWLLLALWLLPIFCWLLFCSAAARKAPFLIALGVPLAAIVLEAWVLGSAHFGGIVKNQLYAALTALQTLLHHPGQFVSLFGEALTVLALWMGLVLSVIFIAISVWLRRQHYEI
jgi:ABC-2 type transport system permease protein